MTTLTLLGCAMSRKQEQDHREHGDMCGKNLGKGGGV